MSDILNEARRKSVGQYLDSQSRLNTKPVPETDVSAYDQQAQSEIKSVTGMAKERNASIRAEVAKQLAPAPIKASAQVVDTPYDATVIGNNTEQFGSFKQTLRTSGQSLQDTGVAIAEGLSGAWSSIGKVSVMAGIPLRRIKESLTNEDVLTVQQALTEMDSVMGVTSLNSWLETKKSSISKDKIQELQSIKNSRKLSEGQKFAATEAFYRTNPDMAAFGVATSLVRSIAEIKGTSKVLGLFGKLGTVAATNAGVGVSGGAGYLSNAQSKGTATDNTLVNAIFAGAGTAVIGHGLNKVIGGTDIDQLGVAGFTKGQAGISNYLKGIAKEGVEELGQGSASLGLDNHENNRKLTTDIGSTSIEGLYLGLGSGAMAGAPSLVANSTKAGVAKTNDVIANRDNKKNGATAENLDPTNEKFNPVREYKKSLDNLNSTDPKLRQEAEANIVLASKVVNEELTKRDDAIAAETDDAAKKVLLAEKAKYETTVLDPLRAEVATYQNALKQNSDAFLNDLSTYASQPRAQSLSLSSMDAQAKAQLEEAKKNVVVPTVSVDQGVTNTSAPTQSTGRSLSGLIQSGESGKAGHTAVNYGKYNKKGNIDPTTMTLGAIADGLKRGDYVAVGKYQFHKSSFPDIFKSGNVSGINRNTVFTPEIQDKIFAEYYVGKKREDLGKFIRGENVSIKAATDALANEWQAAEGFNGRGRLGAGATIKSADIQAQLKESRAIYSSLVANGTSPAKAMQQAVLGSMSSGTSSNEATKAPVSVDSYLKYENSGSQRNEKLDTALEKNLSFLSNYGAEFRVSSGGQSDTSKGKVGSTAHNHGKAADGDIYVGNRKLDWNNAQDMPVLANIVEEAALNGINGIGAGNNYMGGGRFHFGMQRNSAAWGAGGKGTNALPWVKAAHARGLARRLRGELGTLRNTEGNIPSGLKVEVIKMVENKLAEAEATYEANKNIETVGLTEEESEIENVINNKTRNMYSSMNTTQINNHPLLSNNQKVALRKMLGVKQALNANKDIDKVNKEIYEGSVGRTRAESNLGMQQYEESINQAIGTNDASTVNKYLGMLDRFVENHTLKNKIIEDNITTATKSSPLYVAPDVNNVWSVVDPTNYADTEFKDAGGLELWGPNKLTAAIAVETKDLNEFRDSIRSVASGFVAGINPASAPIAPVGNTPPVTTTVPVVAPIAATAPVTPVTSTTPPVTPVSTPTPITTPTSTYTKIGNISKTPTDGVYLGRGDNGTFSMSNVKASKDGKEATDVGKQGWLASPFNKEHGTPTERLGLYIEEFKSKVASFDNFAQGVVDLKGKPLFASAYTPALSETEFLGKLLQDMPDNIEAARAYIERIESYNPIKGIVLSKEKAKPFKIADDSTTNDNTFGLINNNQYQLNEVNDETLKANKISIDSTIDTLLADPTASLPVTGIGKSLGVNAPKTLAYLNEQLQERMGTDNQKLLDRAPKDKLENRSSIDAKSNKVGKTASNTLKPTKGKIEKSSNTKVGKKEYSNQYSATQEDGGIVELNVTRDNKTHRIVSVITNITDADGTTETLDTTNSNTGDTTDGNIIDQLEVAFELGTQLEEIDISSESNIDDAPEMTEGTSRIYPKELQESQVLEDVMDTLIPYIQNNVISEKEAVLYTSIIKPILNFNPNLEIRIKEGKGKSVYDNVANLITIREPVKGSNLLQEITRMVVYSSTDMLARKLEDPDNVDMIVNDKDLSKLNKELTEAKQILERVVNNDVKAYRELSTKEKANILEALQSNSNLITMATTNPILVKLLKGINLSKKTSKSSLFRKIVSSLRGLFSIGTNNETANLYDRMIEITAMTVEIQGRNREVNFKGSEQGKVNRLQDLLDTEIKEELSKSFYKRDQFKAVFKQSQSKDKPLSNVSNLASKLKIDLMQGLGAITKLSPTKAQREQMVDFLQFRDEISQHLLDTFRKQAPSKKGETFDVRDLKSYLMDDDGNIDENTITSVALAIYDWSIEYGRKEKNLDKDIKKLLNLDADSSQVVPDYVAQHYLFKTAIKSYVTDSIGRSAVAALNINTSNKASATAQSDLENSIGEWAISAMQSANLIHIQTIASTQHLDNIEEVGGDTTDFKGNKNINENGVVTFVTMNLDDGSGKNPRMEEIAYANKGTLNYLGDVFGIEMSTRLPVLDKPTKIITSIRRTLAKVSGNQQALIKIMQEEAIEIDDITYNAFNRMLEVDNQATREMIGAFVSEETLANTHMDDRFSKQSAAEGVQRELENGKDFIDSLPKDVNGKRSKFYDQVYVAKNNRMHYFSNMFNFQTSKLHRALGQYSNFKTVVKLTEGTPAFFNKNNTTSTTGFFFRSIAEQAEGTKKLMEVRLEGTAYSSAATVDKVPSQLFLPEFYSYLTTDADVAKATTATGKLLTNPKSLTKQDVADITNLVNKWEGKAGSLRALIELTKYNMALRNGDTEFTTSVGLSSDGVNNGSALSYVLMGVANNTFLAQVGMLVKGSKFENFFDTKLDKVLGDYYEGFGTVLKYVTSKLAYDPDIEVVMDKTTNKPVPTKRLSEKDSNQMYALINLNSSFHKRAFLKAILIPFGYSAGMKRLKGLAFGQLLEDIKSEMVEISKLEGKEESEKRLELERKLYAVLGREIKLPEGKEILEFWLDFKDIKELKEIYLESIGKIVEVSLKQYAGKFIEARDLNVKIQTAASDAFIKLTESIMGEEKQKYLEHLAKDPIYAGLDSDALSKVFIAEGIPADYFNEFITPRINGLRPSIGTPLNNGTNDPDSNFVLTKQVKRLAGSDYAKASNWRVNQDGKLVPSLAISAVSSTEEEGVGVMTNSAQVQGMDAYVAARTSAQGGKVNINVHDAGISGMDNYTAMVVEQNKATYEGLRDYAAMVESLLGMAQMLSKIRESQDVETALKYEKSMITTIFGEKSESTLKDLIYIVQEAQTDKLITIKNLKVVHQYAGENGEYNIGDDTANITKAKEASDKLIAEIHTLLLIKKPESTEKSVVAVTKDTPYLTSITDFLRTVKSISNPNFVAYRRDRLVNEETGQEVKGMYNSTTNTVILNNNLTGQEKKEAEIHEILHAFTEHNIRNNMSEEVREAVGELEAMMVDLRETVTDPFIKDYVLSEVSEFVAYGLSESRYLAYIANNLKGDYKSKNKTRKAKLMDFMRNAITLITGKKAENNAKAFIRLADSLMKDSYEQYGAPGKVMYSTVNNTSTSDILKSLDNGTNTAKHSAHLDGLISRFITPFYDRDAASALIVDDVMTNNSIRAAVAGYKLSDKELHVLEVLKAISKSYLDSHSGSKTVNEIEDMFKQVTSKMTYETFLDDVTTATTSEIAKAKKMVAYIKDQRGKNKYEQLENFLALSVVSEEFGKVINKIPKAVRDTSNDSWFDKLMGVVENIVRWLTTSTLKTKGLRNNQELAVLFNRLNSIDYNARNAVDNQLDVAINFAAGVIAKPANFATNKLINGIFKVLNFSHSKTAAFSGLSNVLNAARNMQNTDLSTLADTYVEQNAKYGRNDGSNKLTGLGEVINELARTQGMKQLVGEQIQATNKAGQLRQSVKDASTKILRESFTDNAENIAPEQLDSLTQVALRTDISSLLDNGFNVTRVLKLLTSRTERMKEVTRLEANINRQANGNDIIMQTKSLAKYIAKEDTSKHMVKNAEAIAIGLGSWYQIPLASMDMDLRNDIDSLASLYAVEMTTKSQREALKSLINDEYEGVKAMLQVHKDLIKQSKEEFDANPYNYSKGYVPQDTHHLRSLRFAESALEVIKLKAQGWEEITELGLRQDNTDGTDARTLMFHNDMLYHDYVSGALDMKDTHSKGSQVYSMHDMGELTRVTNTKATERRARNSTSSNRFNPLIEDSNNLIADYSSEGIVIGYHYEMSGHMRDTYLERNNNALDLLGTFQSDLTFKPEIRESQEAVARTIHKDFVASYVNNPRLFVTLDPKSNNPDVVAMYNMMPFAFRNEATKLFGKGNPIVVRSNVYNSIFGFQSYSVSKMFEKLTGEKNAIENIVTTIMTAIFKDKAMMRALQGERIWQGAIKNIKDFVVMRNIKVLIGNIVSNSLLLSLQGVNPTDQIKDFISVWRNGGKYRKTATRIIEIDQELRINASRPKEVSRLKREKNIAEMEMKRNPMHVFMEAGLMSTIVEDVKLKKDDTTFKSDLDKQIEEYAGYIPSQITTAFEWVIMSPGTPLHNFMAHSTQFSDLAAKYSLTKKLMRDGQSLRDSIAVAQDNFINYDVPTSKGLDYMNRMGFFMFTKFFIRFQSVLTRLLNEKAGSTIAQHLAVEHFTGLSGILDPFALTRIGNNPLEPGIFNYNEAFNNISSVDFITGILN